MTDNNTVEAARAALGPIGFTLPVSFTEAISMPEQRAAINRLERAGYRTVWANEGLGGKDAFVQLAVLLGATERMVFGTAITNIWAREPQITKAAAAQLAQAYPGRFVLGLGVGYPEQAASAGREFGRPLATMRDYLARMDTPATPPAPDVRYPRILAAVRPKMLALAGEISDGAVPAGLPPAATTQARKTLGADKLLVVGMWTVPDSDRERAKTVARQRVSTLLDEPAYGAAMAGLGYSEQDIAEVSDHLVDAIIANGDPATIAERAREHLAAGADHVTLLLPIGIEFAVGIAQLEQLAPALTEITG